MEPLIFLFGLVGLFAVVMVISGIKVVQQAQVMMIERLGKFHRRLDSGIHFIIPFLDKAREVEWKEPVNDYDGSTYYMRKTITRLDLREIVYDFPRQNVITKDNVNIEINALVYFQVTDPERAVYKIANLPDAIEKLTQTTLRSVIGELELDECLSSREKINTKLQLVLDDATDKWGVKVNRVELQDINPPEDIQVAMEKQMRAERDRRAKILEAEGEKRSAILTAEGAREAQIARAEGQKEAQILEAKGLAEARLTVATAEADSIAKVQEAFQGKEGDPASYLVAIKYIDALKDMSSGDKNKMVFMPYEASGILGSLGSMKAMLNEVKDQGK